MVGKRGPDRLCGERCEAALETMAVRLSLRPPRRLARRLTRRQSWKQLQGALLGFLALGVLGCRQEPCNPRLDPGLQWCVDLVSLDVLDPDESPVVWGQALWPGAGARQDVRMLVDTGASQTVVSSALVEAADQTYLRMNLCWDQVCVNNLRVLAWETPFSTLEPEGFAQVIVGMDVLGQMTVGIDQGRVVHFAPVLAGLDDMNAQGSLLGGVAPNGDTCETLPVTSDGSGRPMVMAAAEEAPLRLTLLDTGARRVLLSPETVSRLGAVWSANATPEAACSAAGCQGQAWVRGINKYCVGAVCRDDVLGKFPAFDAVGMSFLKHHSMWLAGASEGRTLTVCPAPSGL